MTRALAYYRESTADQGQSGLGLAAQKETIHREGKARGWQITDLPPDIASGKSVNGRKVLQQALAMMDAHEAEILVSAKLDRISRSVVDFGQMLERAQKRHWSLVVLDLGLDMSTPTGELIANVLVSVAQFERLWIAERTRDALAQIPRGTTHLDKDGNVKQPPGAQRQISNDDEAVIRYLRQSGKSYRQICAALTDMGKVPPNGGKWQPSTLQRILQP